MKRLFENIPVIKAEFKEKEAFNQALGFILEKGLEIENIFTPCPVEIQHPAVNKPFKAGKTAFWSGLAGLFTGIAAVIYFQLSYPLVLGNKPSVPYISMIPAGFVLFILAGAIGLLLAFFLKENLFPGQQNKVYTNGHFCILLRKEKIGQNEIEWLYNLNGISISEDIYIKQQIRLPLPLIQLNHKVAQGHTKEILK